VIEKWDSEQNRIIKIWKFWEVTDVTTASNKRCIKIYTRRFGVC